MQPRIYRWVFYSLLLLFVAAKVPHLNDAFYWDESWVYAPAVSYMYDNGPSLMPNAIPVDYSHGHPTLFHSACAAWMHVFGKSHFSMHCFALAIAIVLIVALYEVLARLFNRRVALIAGVLLLINANFFVVSSLVLTDVALALFSFLSIYYYAKGRFVPAALTLTLLYYTKESGWVMAFVIFADIAFDIFNKKGPIKQVIPKALTLVVPLGLTFLFFLGQKVVNGWFLYPAHTQIINASIENVLHNIQRTLVVILGAEYVYLHYTVLFLLLIAIYMRTREKKYAFALLVIAIAYLMTLVFGYKDAVFYAFVIGLFIALVWFFRKKLQMNVVQARFIKFSIAFCVLFTYISSINFYEERYMFVVFLLLSVILFAVVCNYLITKLAIRLFWPVLVLLGLIGICSFREDSKEWATYEHIEVQQSMTDYMEAQNFYNKHICCFSYLGRIHLDNPRTGFLRSDKYFHHVGYEINDSTDLVICDNIESADEHEAVRKDTSFVLLKRLVCSGFWVEIYQRKKSR